jgi:hypothetical protein
MRRFRARYGARVSEPYLLIFAALIEQNWTARARECSRLFSFYEIANSLLTRTGELLFVEARLGPGHERAACAVRNRGRKPLAPITVSEPPLATNRIGRHHVSFGVAAVGEPNRGALKQDGHLAFYVDFAARRQARCVELTVYRYFSVRDQRRIHAEVDQLKDGLGDGSADQFRVAQERVLTFTRHERAVHEETTRLGGSAHFARVAARLGD